MSDEGANQPLPLLDPPAPRLVKSDDALTPMVEIPRDLAAYLVNLLDKLRLPPSTPGYYAAYSALVSALRGGGGGEESPA